MFKGCHFEDIDSISVQYNDSRSVKFHQEPRVIGYKMVDVRGKTVLKVKLAPILLGVWRTKKVPKGHTVVGLVRE